MGLAIEDREKVSRTLQVARDRCSISRPVLGWHRAQTSVLDEPVKGPLEVRFGSQQVTYRIGSICMGIRSPRVLHCRWGNIQPRHRCAQLRKKPYIMTGSTTGNQNTAARKTRLFHKFSKGRRWFTMIPRRVSRTPAILPEIPDFSVCGLSHDKTVDPQRKSCQLN